VARKTKAETEFIPRGKTVLRNMLMPSSCLVDEPEFDSFTGQLIEHEDELLDPQDAPVRGYYQHGARAYRPTRLA